MMPDRYFVDDMIARSIRLGTQLGPILRSNPKDRKEDPRKVCVPSKKKRAALRAARKGRK